MTPRPPLAVRRTPDSPRLRVVSRAVRAVEREPALEFETTRDIRTVRTCRARSACATGCPRLDQNASVHLVDLSGPVIRMVAAAIDHVLLVAIDLAVIYFTLAYFGTLDERLDRASCGAAARFSCCC